MKGDQVNRVILAFAAVSQDLFGFLSCKNMISLLQHYNVLLYMQKQFGLFRNACLFIIALYPWTALISHGSNAFIFSITIIRYIDIQHLNRSIQQLKFLMSIKTLANLPLISTFLLLLYSVIVTVNFYFLISFKQIKDLWLLDDDQIVLRCLLDINFSFHYHCSNTNMTWGIQNDTDGIITVLMGQDPSKNLTILMYLNCLVDEHWKNAKLYFYFEVVNNSFVALGILVHFCYLKSIINKIMIETTYVGTYGEKVKNIRKINSRSTSLLFLLGEYILQTLFKSMMSTSLRFRQPLAYPTSMHESSDRRGTLSTCRTSTIRRRDEECDWRICDTHNDAQLRTRIIDIEMFGLRRNQGGRSSETVQSTANAGRHEGSSAGFSIRFSKHFRKKYSKHFGTAFPKAKRKFQASSEKWRSKTSEKISCKLSFIKESEKDTHIVDEIESTSEIALEAPDPELQDPQLLDPELQDPQLPDPELQDPQLPDPELPYSTCEDVLIMSILSDKSGNLEADNPTGITFHLREQDECLNKNKDIQKDLVRSDSKIECLSIESSTESIPNSMVNRTSFKSSRKTESKQDWLPATPTVTPMSETDSDCSSYESAINRESCLVSTLRYGSADEELHI